MRVEPHERGQCLINGTPERPLALPHMKTQQEDGRP